MGERRQYAPGTFCWVDLATPDPAQAKSFYAGLFGWEAEDMPAGDQGVYTMLRKDGKYVGALYEQFPEQREQGIPPNWLSYVTVDDVGRIAGRARDLGATVMQEPMDVLDVGRMALVADPEGAILALWEPIKHPGAGLVNEPGSLCWNELRTKDPDQAQTFYTQLFGWGTESSDMGNGLTYTTIKVGDKSNGGIMPMMPGMEEVPPHWGAYFAAEDCDKAVARVQELGGDVVLPPMDVPVGRFASVADPQGAVFSLFSGNLDP